jgi:hypothetical protein
MISVPDSVKYMLPVVESNAIPVGAAFELLLLDIPRSVTMFVPGSSLPILPVPDSVKYMLPVVESNAIPVGAALELLLLDISHSVTMFVPGSSRTNLFWLVRGKRHFPHSQKSRSQDYQ